MSNTYLTVPFKEKDSAKALGARWDADARRWYVPAGQDLVPFAAWLPDLPQASSTRDVAPAPKSRTAERITARGQPTKGSHRLEPPPPRPHLLATQRSETAMSQSAYETLQRLAGTCRIRLTHSAISLHDTGPAAHDDLWTLTVDERGVPRIHNTVTNHFWDLAPSDVVDITPDASVPHGGLPHYRLTLARPLWLKGMEAGWGLPGQYRSVLHRPRPSQLATFRRWVAERQLHRR